MKKYLTLALVGLTFATGARAEDAAPEWLGKIVLSPVFIRDDKGSLGYSAEAEFTVENHGTEMSRPVVIRCTFFDDLGNTVAMGSETVGKIKAGRQGFGKINLLSLDEKHPPRATDCEIGVYSPPTWN